MQVRHRAGMRVCMPGDLSIERPHIPDHSLTPFPRSEEREGALSFESRGSKDVDGTMNRIQRITVAMSTMFSPQ